MEKMEGGVMMGKEYRNLKAEMERFGISTKNIAECIGKNERTVRNKLNGDTDFSWSETCKIQHEFFPEISKDYLFGTTKCKISKHHKENYMA